MDSEDVYEKNAGREEDGVFVSSCRQCSLHRGEMRQRGRCNQKGQLLK